MKSILVKKLLLFIALIAIGGVSTFATAGKCTNATDLSFENNSSQSLHIRLTNMEGDEFTEQRNQRGFSRIGMVKVGSTAYSGSNWIGGAELTSHESYMPYIELKNLPSTGTHTVTVDVVSFTKNCASAGRERELERNCDYAEHIHSCTMDVTYKEKTLPYFIQKSHDDKFKNEAFSVKFTARDSGRDLTNVIIKKDHRILKTCSHSGGAHSLDCNINYSIGSLPVGGHSWTAIATDKYNNTRSKTVAFNIIEPNSAPVISDIIISNNRKLQPGEDALVSFKITDADSQTYNQMILSTFTINGSSYRSANNCTLTRREITCTDLPIAATPSSNNGGFPITVRVMDGPNEDAPYEAVSSTATVIFNYAPNARFNALPDSVFKDEPVNVIATVSDDSGVQLVNICLNPKGQSAPVVAACSKLLKKCQYSDPLPANTECLADFTYAELAENYDISNSNEWYISLQAKDKEGLGLSTAINHLLVFRDRFNFAASKIVKDPNNPLEAFLVGDVVTAKVKVAAFSSQSEKLTALHLTSSNESQAVSTSPSMDISLPQASSEQEAQEVSISWQAMSAGDHAIMLTLTDNTGSSITKKLDDILVKYPTPAKPTRPKLQINAIENGYELSVSDYNHTKEFIVNAYLGDSTNPHQTRLIKVNGITTTDTFYTSTQMHGQLLTYKVTGVNYDDRNPTHKIEGDTQEQSIEIDHPIQNPMPPKFNELARQMGGRYTLIWPDNSDGVTSYYKVISWRGLPSDKTKNPNYESEKLTTRQFPVSVLEQGRVTYELVACNAMDLCTAGQQKTIEHMAPILRSIDGLDKLKPNCDQEVILSFSGLFLGGRDSKITVRIRATGELIEITKNSFSNHVVTAKADQKICTGLQPGGLNVYVSNGVSKNGKILESIYVVDSTDVDGQPDLLDSQMTISDNGYLYVGRETGLAGYSTHGNTLTKLWLFEPETHNSGRADIPAKVTARPLVESVSINDHIYFGSENHQFYKLRHRPNEHNGSLRKVQDWLFTSKGPIVAPAQLDQDGNLYVGSMDSSLYSLDKESGQVQWQYNFPSGVNHQVDVAAGGQIYVKTADGELHVIDRRLLSANAIKWQELGILYDAFREHIDEWENSHWQPNQEHTKVVGLTKAMLILLQRSPSKEQLSLLAYLYEIGYSFNEIISALINANPELANTDDINFINTLFKYFIGELTGNDVLGGNSPAYWVERLQNGSTRAEVFVELLRAGAAREQYNTAAYSLLYYFYDFCLLSHSCDYDYDSDADGLSNQVEIELGTNPVDPSDGLSAPSLSLIKQGTETIELTVSSTGLAEVYELYVSKHNQNYYRAEVIAAKSALDGPVFGDTTYWAKQYENGEYRFKVKACVRVVLKNNPRVLHCSNNFSNEVSEVIYDSTQTAPLSISIPFEQAENDAPSMEVLLEHARLSPTLGSFRVSESGSATYTIPIELPAGITGVKPSVSLDYNSQTSRTNIALGWSLNAASSISRCRQTKAHDGQFKGLTLSDEDRYCLDGQRLIRRDDNEYIEGFDTLATFETEIKSHQVIILTTSPETDSNMFVVRGKDGSYKYFGGTANSEVSITDEDEQKHTLTWLLEKATDNLQKDATSIKYVYTRDGSLGKNEKVLSKIEYSGNTVEFLYSRTDVYHSSYIDGVKIEQAAYLDDIIVKNHDGFVLREYSPTFSEQSKGIRLLNKVAECRNKVCKRPIYFDYTPFADELSYKSHSEIFSTAGSNKLAAMTLIDTQGDGTAEVATLEKIGDKRYALCFWEGSTFEEPNRVACRDIYRFDNAESVNVQVVDANGDGKQSLWISLQSSYNGSQTANDDYWTSATVNTSSIDLTSLPLSDSYGPFVKNSQFADFNGDGYADLIFQQKEVTLPRINKWHGEFSDNNDIFVALFDPNADEFLLPNKVYSNLSDHQFQLAKKNKQWYAMDANFDGLADIISLSCSNANCDEDKASHIYIHLNQGLSHTGFLNPFDSGIFSQGTAKDIEHLTPADVNGDGLVDFIYLKTELSSDNLKGWRVALNKSSERIWFEDKHFAWAKTLPEHDGKISSKIAPLVMDVNKDGQIELYFPTELSASNSSFWTQFVWQQDEEKFVKAHWQNTFNTPDVHFEQGDYAFFSDYNQDGVPDLLFKTGNRVLVKYNLEQSPYEGTLSKVTQGYGNKTRIRYALMSDESVYKPFSSANEQSDFAEDKQDYSAFEHQGLKVSSINGGAMALVAAVETDSPSSANDTLTSSIAYSYEGAQVQFGGRGMLGFKSLTTTHVKSGHRFTTTTRYHQAFPLTGMPARTIKAYDGTVISSAVNTYAIQPSNYSSGTAYHVYNQIAKECNSILNLNMSPDIGANQCSSTETTQDTFGNVTTIRVNRLSGSPSRLNSDYSNHQTWQDIDSLDINSSISSVFTSNVYGQSDNDKKLGRLSQSTVTHSAVGSDHTLKTNFTYYEANHDNAYMLENEIIAQGMGCELELTTHYKYDSRGNQVSTMTTNSGCEGDDRKTRETETTYTSEGRYRLTTKQKVNKDKKDLWTKGSEVIDRNAFGQATTVKTVDGVVIKTLYDVFGGKVGTYSASGAQSYRYLSTCYDSDICVVQSNKIVNGELVEKQFLDRLGRVYKTSTLTVLGTWLDTKVEYDRYGRAVKQKQPGSAGVSTRYDAFDRVQSMTDHDSYVTTTYYQNELTQTVELSGLGVSTGRQTTVTVNNVLGQVDSVTDPMGNTLKYTYDSRGNQLSVRSSADGDAVLLNQTYDLLGRKIAVSDINSGNWTYEYNAFGELTKQTDARGVATNSRYDLLGRKVRQWQSAPSNTAASREATESAYIEQNDIVYEGESTWLFGDQEHNVHQLQSATQGDEWSQYYYYDTFGRTAATLTALETQQCDGEVVFNPRLNDLRIKKDTSNKQTQKVDLTDPLSSLCVIQQFAYDEFGRVSLQFDDYRRLESGQFIDARGIRNTYKNGLVIAKHEAREGQYGQRYYKVQTLNSRGQVTGYKKGDVLMSVSYDRKGMVKTISSTDYSYIQADSYHFDGLGNLLSRAQLMLPEQSYEYDLLNRVTHIQSKKVFGYSASGNLIEKADFTAYTQSNGVCNRVYRQWSQTYGEGEAPQHAITSRQYNTANIEDSCGNVNPIIIPPIDVEPPIDIGPPGDRESDGQPNVQSVDERTVIERFSYDKNGNQTNLYIDNALYRSVAYTGRNKAAKLNVNGKLVRFNYDVNNRRYKREDDNQTIYYVGALELTVRSTEGGDTAFVKRYIGNDAQQKYFMNGNSALQWMFTDHQGSIIAVTNRNYELLARYSYDVFGAQKSHGAINETDALNFTSAQRIFDVVSDNFRGYTGHEPVKIGDDSRIIHMNGRIYDVDTGRFMQADPFVQAPSNLQNYNRYSYVLNNPLSYTDPSGYWFKKLLKGAMKATGTWQLLRSISQVSWLNSMINIGLNFILGCQAWCSAAYSAASTFAVTGSLNKGLLAGFSAAAMPGGEGIGAIAASAMIGGATSKLMGGNFGHGFFSAGLGAAAGGVGRGIRNPVGQVLVGAIVGGTVSKVTGGKFANGAFNAAFSAALRADWRAQGSKGNSNGRTGSVCSANPINISTGEKYFTMRDYQAAGNSRLKFERYYFSYSKTKSSLGIGWSHNFDRKLEFIKGNKQLVRYLGLNKRERTFSRKNSKHDSYENTANSSEHLQQIDRGWVLTLADGTTEIFNEHGLLIEVHEVGLYQQFLKYNNKGMLTSVTDSMGVEVHLEYNLAGLLTKLETPEGTFEYEYNLANRTLVKALRPASRDGERGYKKYHYGNYEYRSAITHISNEKGNILHRVRYDDNGRAVSSALGSDIEKVNIRFLPNNQSIVTNSLGFKTTYTFNESNQPLNVAGDGGTSCLSTNQQYEYDSRGNVIKSTDWNGVVTTYSYNDRDLEISRTEALGIDIERTTLTEWHDLYPIKKLIQTEKAKQVFEYSDSGLLLSHTTFDLTAEQSWLQNLMEVFPSRTTHYDYNSRGLVVEVDGPRTDVADVTTYEYDELGNQISVTNALGHKTEVTKHNPSGRPLVITHANGSMTELTYNESGWVSSKTKVTSVDAKVVKATTFYEYANSGDNLEQGLVKRIVYPNGGATTYTYDEAYRVKTIGNHLGEKVEYVRDLEGNPIKTNVFSHSGELVKQQRQQFNELSQLITSVGVNSQVSYQYNGNGQVTATTNGLGNTTQHAFDALNRLVQITDADGGIFYQTYDLEDQLTHFTDQRGLTTEYQYNGFGEKVRQVSPDTGTTVYKHNAAGLVIEKVDNSGQVVSYEYDAIGRVTHVHFVGAANEDIFYQYDEQLFDSAQPPAVSGAIGKVTRILDNSGDSQYQYNGQGYLTSKTYQIEGRQYSQGFNYKDNGLLDSQVYPSGMVVSYGYDEAGRVNTLFSNSLAGNTTTLVENVDYLPFSEPELISYGNGIMQQNTYDTDGRMEEILLKNGLNTLLNRHYVYDEANQITNILNVKDDVLSEYFEYDNQGRLTFASGEYGQLSYDYDQVGNRLNRRWLSKYSELLEDESYQYALNSNQLEQVLPISKPERVFEYNVNGQTTVDTLNGKSLVYNAANRLSEITFRDGSQVQYVYNAKGQRVAKVQTASNGEKTTTHYHFDQNNLLIAESNAQGEPLVEYIYLNKQRVASIRYMGSSHVVDYVHNDHLGSPMVQTDISGKLTWRSNTLPFGQSYKVTVAEQGFGFPGQYHDVESGYSYNYFRDYDPSLGRYIQSDPIGLAGGVNTYGYVLGNPIQSSDTWGLYVDPDWYHGARPVKAMNFGTAVHSHVNRQFNQMGYSVEGAGFARSFFGGGRPDIVDPRTSQVWEIKPMSYGGGTAYNKAVSQINGYADASGLKIGNSIDLVGEYFDANIMFFDGAAYHIGLYPYTNGLVLYDVTKLTNEQALAYYYAIDQTAKSTILGHQNKEVNACPVF